MKRTTPDLTTDQKDVLNILKRSFGRPWISALALWFAYRDQKWISARDQGQLNQLTGQLSKIVRDLERSKLIERRLHSAQGNLHWDVRLSRAGQSALRQRDWVPTMGAIGLAVAATACSSLMPLQNPPTEPPKATFRPVVATPELVQLRDENGRVYWAYCSEDCPQPTPKKVASEMAAAVATTGQTEAAVAQAILKEAGATKRTLTLGEHQPTVPVAKTTEVYTEVKPITYSIFFKLRSAELTIEGKRAIGELIPDMLRAESVNITGRADPGRIPGLSENLSQARAAVVKAEIVRAGIDPTKVSTKAKVEISPLEHSYTPLNTEPSVTAEKSRRTDITVSLLVLRRKR